jgi:hypothetical protein
MTHVGHSGSVCYLWHAAGAAGHLVLTEPSLHEGGAGTCRGHNMPGIQLEAISVLTEPSSCMTE